MQPPEPKLGLMALESFSICLSDLVDLEGRVNI